MKIRLGYACITSTLDGITTSSTYSYNNFLKENDIEKLYKIIGSNFLDLEKILDYNIKNNITFYRLSSKIVPLSTIDGINIDYSRFQDIIDRIKEKIKKYNLRLDLHTDQFCVLNSINPEVVRESIKIIEYHYKILDLFDIEDKVIILHIGSCQCGKKASLTRFINNYNKLDKSIRNAIVIENDDKIFDILDCLYLKDKLGVRIVLDYHHYLCNSGGVDINLYLDKIFDGWVVPKIHFSSPKSKLKKEFRSHSDYINVFDFIKFLDILKSKNKDFDIMLEAKAHDDAIFRLVRLLKYYTDYYFINETVFII